MNELQLSSDLNVITSEIEGYKNMAGQSIFEIGRRLKHVKENDLVHGQWEKWCNEALNITRQQAFKYIKVFDEFSNVKSTYHLSVDALYLISTIPEEEREQPHIIPSTNETKTVDKMTVKELKEVKAALKRAEEQVDVAKKSEVIALRKLEELENQEVDPKKLKKELDKKEKEKKEALQKEKSFFVKEQEKWKAEKEKLKSELTRLKKLNDFKNKEKEKEQELKYLNYESNKTPLSLKLNIDSFLEENAITAFRKGAIAASSEETRAKLNQGIEELEGFCKEMKVALTGRLEINN